MTELIFILLATYFIGGIPFSWLAAKIFWKCDLRTVGSGNVGATNACRLFPKRWRLVAFVCCFTLDALKGYLPSRFLAPLLADGPLAGRSAAELAILVGLAAILGHVFTPYLKFRGGKGVATTMGVFLAAAPLAVIITVISGIIITLVSRYVSLGSIVMAILLPVLVYVFHPGEWLLFALTVLAGVFIIFKHRTNIQRLLQGREARLFSKQFSVDHNQGLEQ